MADEQGSQEGLVLIAFVLGAVAGAVGALLLAPQTGAQARRKLAERAREGRDTLASAVERGPEAVDQVANDKAPGSEATGDQARRPKESV